jgi:hypothetical protein
MVMTYSKMEAQWHNMQIIASKTNSSQPMLL